MKLRITTPDSKRDFMSGAEAHIFLDDIDVGRYIHRLELTLDAEEIISAQITLYSTGVDLEVPAIVQALLKDAEESGALAEGSVEHT